MPTETSPIIIDQSALVKQQPDWDVLETHAELYEAMEQEPNPDTGKRWWSARKFADRMEMKWQDFHNLLLNAKKQVHEVFGKPDGHFTAYRKMSFDRLGRSKTDDDYRLSIYAVYLILMLTRKDTEFIKKAKADFSMLAEVGKAVVEMQTGRQMMAEAELSRLAKSRVDVADISLDATDAIQAALGIAPGTPRRDQLLPDGSNPYEQYRIIIKLLLTGLYPYQIKQALEQGLRVPTQDLMGGEMLDCEILMHDRIARKIRRETNAARKRARRNNAQWNGLEWSSIIEITNDVGKQAVDDCLTPAEIEQSLWGSDVGVRLLEARRTVERMLAAGDEPEAIEA